MSKLKGTLNGVLALSLMGLLLAPFNASAQAATQTYEITLTNITNSMQALSPVVVATHSPSVRAWQMGGMASKGLEVLAEDGRPDIYADELKGVAYSVAPTHAHLLPKDSITVYVTARRGDVLSAATMLIQTNDGFTGLDSVPLTDGDIETMVYDAGTEQNTELHADIPGFGGPFHGPETTPRQAIAMHENITGRGEATPEFKWSGPVARFSIRAIDPLTVAPNTYEVTLTNITASRQALSPVVVASHSPSVRAWQVGGMSSKGLEILAEDGMPDAFAAELQPNVTDVATTKSHLFPGDYISVRVRANEGDVISTATMLIQTNDGFTGLESAPLTFGDTDPMVYDAGTEVNTEMRVDIPGFGGPFHGPETTPRQAIAMHEGITGKAEVRATYNWSEPVARFTISAVDSTSTIPGGMPRTGDSTPALWLLAAFSALLALGGLTVRRTATTRRSN